MRELIFNKRVLSWAFYDWANSAFAMTIMAAFFPIMFKSFYNVDVDAAVSTARLGFVTGMAGLLVAVLAPVLGAVADRSGKRKTYLLVFAFVGAINAGALYFVDTGNWQAAAWIYGCGSVGFMLANVFNDAMVVEISPQGQVELVSSFGFSLGYLGSSLLFLVHAYMTINPQFFGLVSASDAVRIAFFSVAVWWALFSLPLFFFVKETPRDSRQNGFEAILGGVRQLGDTFRHIRKLKPAFLFLLAYWLYIDGVHTIIKMAVDFGLSIGFSDSTMIVAIIIVNLIGFPATLLAGLAGKRFGPRPVLVVCITAYLGLTMSAHLLQTTFQFYLMATVIGLVQGGVQSMSRALFARLIPEARAGEFFGFYNMSGRFASVIGPFLMGMVALATGNSRFTILALAVLFIPGLVVLFFVQEKNSTHSVAARLE